MSAQEKLATWRGQLTDALNTSLDGGSLPLIAAVHTAIAAIETEEQLAAATNSARPWRSGSHIRRRDHADPAGGISDGIGCRLQWQQPTPFVNVSLFLPHRKNRAMISETMQGRFDPPVLAGQTSLKPTFPG